MLKNVSLKKYTTFKIGGPARYFWQVKTKDDLIQAIKFAKEAKLPYFVLGGGSNLLVADEGFDGIVVRLQATNYKLQADKIICDAGLPLSRLVNIAIENSLSGIEWASGIPGTVGGAVRGNAGAFGMSMKDIVESAEVLDVKNLKFKIYNLKKCGFGYRNSIFKKDKNLIIFSVVLKLRKNKTCLPAGREKIKEYLDYRKSRHPKEPSAGSVFKNLQLTTLLTKKFPEFLQFKERGNIPAAFLLAECGLKGKKIGGAKISEQHPNFILNFNQAKARDVKKLINLVKKKVKNKFNITLTEEIQHL